MTWWEFQAEWLGPETYIVCHTSGSTGTPKEIRLPKEQVSASARRTLQFFNLGSHSHFHSCLAPDYIGGKMMMVRALECGGSFTWEHPSNRPLSDYTGGQIDLLCVVPSQMRHILQNIDTLPELGAILIGGSPIPDDLRIQIALSRLQCWETYGMTETASHVAIRRVSEPQQPFRPLPGIKLLQNDSGCLEIEIPGWRRFITNDVVKMDSESRFSILGRADNVIITGGLKVHPEQVEATLRPHLPFDFMITSEPDSKWGERVVMLADRSEAPLCATPDDESIIAICKSVLLPFQVPKTIKEGIVPRTPNGKVARRRK